MRICVVGAGAIGGYFGGRLAQAGRDVTFLVRPARAARLAADGLRIRSRFGDVTLERPRTVRADAIPGSFDLVILSCKAFDLADAVASMAPAVGAESAILPLLNGMSHLDLLDERFGTTRVLGGQCLIGSTLAPDGAVLHLNDVHTLTFGERDGSRSPRIGAIEAEMAGATFAPQASGAILLDMWEKWVFLASLAAATSLMRAGVGDIVAAPGGRDFMLGILDESRAIAAASGYAPRPDAIERTRNALTAAGSPSNASMARDIAAGARIEADHVVGDLIARGRRHGIATPRLDVAYTHLKAYEARRAREAGPA